MISYDVIDIGDLRPEQAAPYACSGLTTYSAIRTIAPQVLAEETVVVIGAGGLGLMCVTLLRALDCKRVIVLEPDGAPGSGAGRWRQPGRGCARRRRARSGQARRRPGVGGDRLRAISIEGSYIGNLGELQELMALVRGRRPRFIPTSCRCLEDAQAALADLAAGLVVGRQILAPAPSTAKQA